MTPAIEAATTARIKIGIHPYPHDPNNHQYGLEASEALHVPANSVFKTLVIDIGSATKPKFALAVLPVPDSLKLKAAAAALGHKNAAMADPHSAERVTGYVRGGISPIGTRTRLPTVIDISACDQARVYCSGGKRGLDISIGWEDFVLLTNATVASIAR